MLRSYVAPYKMGSTSAKSLARNLGLLRIDATKRLRPCTIINWGRSELYPKGMAKIINTPHAVRNASDKISTLKILKAAGVNTVEFTTDRSVVADWINNDNVVFCRTLTSASQGRGIVVVGMDSLSIPYAPLYTLGFIKTHEYRVHVAFGKVIDFSKKRRRLDVEVHPYIKNYSNGWVFCRQDLIIPDAVAEQSIKAVAALGLDFGAVDIAYKERDNLAKVLEVNTAPGIEGTTLTKYVRAFKDRLRGNYGTAR